MAKFWTALFDEAKGKLGSRLFRGGADGENHICNYKQNMPLSVEKQKTGAKGFGTRGSISHRFLQIIQMSFPERKRGLSGANLFMSLNKEEFCKGVRKEESARKKVKDTSTKADYECVFDYSKLVIAHGSLYPVLATVSVDEETRKVTFTQEKRVVTGACNFEDDQLYGVLIDTIQGFCLLVELKKRGESGMTNVDLDEEWSVKDLAIYVFALSADEKMASMSKCLLSPTPVEA